LGSIMHFPVSDTCQCPILTLMITLNYAQIIIVVNVSVFVSCPVSVSVSYPVSVVHRTKLLVPSLHIFVVTVWKQF
jgi:hypothetical protein